MNILFANNFRIGEQEANIYYGNILLTRYKPLEYISSTQTGGQYIDLGCKLLENTDDIEIDMKYNPKGKGKDNHSQSTLLGNQGASNPYPGFVIRAAYSGNDGYIEGFAKWNFTGAVYTKDRYYHEDILGNSYVSGYCTRRFNNIYNIHWLIDNIPDGQVVSDMKTFLFSSFKSDGTPERFIEADLYYLRIKKGNTVIRDLVPVYDKVQQEAGLLDLVNNVFYKSQGDSPFVGSPTINKYLNIYKKVEFIKSESTGQYINLGCQLMANTDDVQIDIKFSYRGKGKDGFNIATVLDSEYKTNSNYKGFVFRRGDDTNGDGQLNFYLHFPTSNSVQISNGNYNDQNFDHLTYTVGDTYEKTIIIDNIPQEQCSDQPTYLFAALSDKNAVYRHSLMIVYYLKITKGGQVLRDLIPVVRISDNEPGLYDRQNDVFYPSDSGKPFVQGPAIN